jgi:N-hydroxyarylamine O-acetyltransferase
MQLSTGNTPKCIWFIYVDLYLKRLAVALTAQPDLAYLTALQEAHLLAVPFENLSVIRGEPIILDEARLVAKIIERRRGGFCYELNSAFGWLLCQLGFAVTRISARVCNASRQEFGPEFDHMALLVQLDQTYLVDVGFGDSARRPIPLPDGIVEDVSGRYRVMPVGEDAYWLQREAANGWQNQYAFTTQPRQLADYAEMCHYHAHSPDSHFTQRTLCTIATADGRITLSADTLTWTNGDEKRKSPVTSPAEFDRLLAAHFGIVL